jgi:hypothetical protein
LSFKSLLMKQPKKLKLKLKELKKKRPKRSRQINLLKKR